MKKPTTSLEFPHGTNWKIPLQADAICMTLCVCLPWCYHFRVDTLANTFMCTEIKSQYNRGYSSWFYSKHLKGCFTQCCTLLNWFEPRMDLLRLSHLNWMIEVIQSKQWCETQNIISLLSSVCFASIVFPPDLRLRLIFRFPSLYICPQLCLYKSVFFFFLFNGILWKERNNKTGYEISTVEF